MNDEKPLFVRTDFSDDDAWDALCRLVEEPVGEFGFRANVQFVSEGRFEGASVERVIETIALDDHHSFLFIADRHAIADSEHPIIVVDLFETPGARFRVVAIELWGVENNLSLANMDFDEFAGNVDSDGVFRGFSG